MCKALSQSKKDWEREPTTKTCEICDGEGEIEYMVDCPKYFEVLEKGIIRGWIHEECCKEDFKSEPQLCIECCDNEEFFRNIAEYFENCVDIKSLTREELKGVPVYMSDGRFFGITSQMDRLLESGKPLNVVTSIFLDKENGIVYVKDNQKNVNLYSLSMYEEVRRRFSSFQALYPEEFCKKDGPLFLVYRFVNTVVGALIAPRIVEEDVGDMGVEVATTYKNRYLEAEEFFGVVLQPHREDLKSMIQTLSENELIKGVLCPLLNSLGFKGVKSISFHGPGESGGDFHPFYKTNEFGKIVFYSAQAKAVKIRSKAGVKEGNVNQLIDQVKKLFRTPFKSFIDNNERRISHGFIFCSQDITSEARDQLFHEIANRQIISFVDIDDIINSIFEQGISEEILKYCRGKERNSKKTN